MKNLFYILFVPASILAQVTVTNDGQAITVENMVTVTIQGSYVNQTNGGDLGTIDNDGTITLTHDWTNNSANAVFSTNSGNVQLLGTANGQTIGGSNSTEFYDLTVNNTYGNLPQVSTSVDVTVSNTLTMTDGDIDLNTNTLTIGTAAGTPGNLSHGTTEANGRIYDGTLTRHINNVAIADGSLTGFFPMGSSGGRYRPLYLSTSVAPSSGGTVSVTHNAPGAATTPVTVADDVNIEMRQNSTWTITTADGFSGGTYNLNIGGTGFGTIAAITDLRVMLAGSVVGSPGTNAGTTSSPQVKRTGITFTNLSNAFYIGSINSTDSPLPVEMISYNVNLDQTTAVIKWSTVSEINTSHFIVERSLDGANFETVEIIDANNSGIQLNNYIVYDNDLAPGQHYYRIKSVDLDGTFQYSSLYTVELKRDLSAKIFPIPAFNSDLILRISGNHNETIKINIYDSKGSIVYSAIKNTLGTISIDKKSFPSSGKYLIQLNTGNESSTHQVLIFK